MHVPQDVAPVFLATERGRSMPERKIARPIKVRERTAPESAPVTKPVETISFGSPAFISWEDHRKELETAWRNAHPSHVEAGTAPA